MLKIPIHNDNAATASELQAGRDSYLVAEITSEADIPDTRVRFMEFTQQCERSVAAAVIDHQYLCFTIESSADGLDPPVELRDRLFFVVDRNYE
jgi:hypothetical protein